MAAESSAKPRWGRWFGRESNAAQAPESQEKQGPPRWSMGVLNDLHTVQVPGPSPPATARRSSSHGPPADEKKKTKDGKIILEPQPEDSANDPLNWPAWRRDTALFSLGFYCLVGGGITPLLAAGFYDVADDYGVSVEDVSLTTGLYMMGMGLGSVVASPTAILWGKRPVYLAGAILLVISSVWCALSPNFASLIVARIVQGIAVSPVECLPSATIAEIFFLHERAYRIGIYTLLLLGGKNLVPLQPVPVAVVDETAAPSKGQTDAIPASPSIATPSGQQHKNLHVGFAPNEPIEQVGETSVSTGMAPNATAPEQAHPEDDNARPTSARTATPTTGNTAFDAQRADSPHHGSTSGSDYFARGPGIDSEKFPTDSRGPPKSTAYTHTLRHQPARSFTEQLNPWNGRLNHDKWLKVMVRPFILFAYPSVLWSTVIYSCSVGWLIVISETMSVIYRNSDSYNFTALQTGLVYISPFVGGILGTVVAGKVSDIIVRALARRNGGLYEPEFRLIMAIPILLSTVIGLMGFGWSAEERDHWMVPTFFFGVISFGCTMGSTTSITYCVDSYRQYAGEALVTLNFSKNILHGLVFSLFVTHWMASDGPKTMFIWLGVIQLIFCLFSIPMYIFGKRARMWTVRKNFMEKF
ncbi:hypothetical protein ACHAO3_005999 [Verticillium nonalfalfae]